MINAYLKLVLKVPALFILLLILISVTLCMGLRDLRFDHSIEAFMPKDDPEYIEYEDAKKTFGDNSRFLIMAVTHADLWSVPAFEAFNRFLTDIEAYKEFKKEAAQKQLERFNRITSQPEVSFTDITAAFQDHPLFVRLLKRKTPNRWQARQPLPSGALNRLQQSVRQDFELRQAEMIDTILSPFTSNDITGRNNVLETYHLLGKNDQGERIIPRTSEEIVRFKKRLKRNPAFKNGIYAADPKTGEITDFGVIVKFAKSENRPAMVSEILEVIKFHDHLDIVISGVPYVSRQFNTYMERDLYRTTPLVLLVVTLIFFLNFKSFRGVILPLATLTMAEIWTLGLMGHLGRPITAIGITLPPLLIAVGSSYSIHVLNQYYADFNLISPQTKRQGLRTAMTHITMTVTLAGLTTAAAFFTLLSSQVSAIQEWAIFSGVGILFAVFIAITLIPALLAYLPHRYPSRIIGSKKPPRFTLVDRLLAASARGAVFHYKKIYAVVLIIIAVSIAGMTHLRVDTEFLHYFKESDPVRQNGEIIGDKFGGGWGFNIIIDSGKTNGVKSPGFLKTIENLRNWLVAEKNADLNIGRTDAFTDFIKRMHMAMHDGDRSYFKIPENRMTILDYLEIYSGEDEDSDGVYDDFESFVDIFYQKTNLLARLTRKEADRLGTTEIKHILNKVERHLEKSLPDTYTYTVTGYPAINVKLAHYVVIGQLWGLALSLVFVMGVIIFLFRKITAGPLALIDMGVTILINFGIMGWFGIELDMVTSVIATITIGIGVDDTIHFLNTYRAYHPRLLNVPDTIEKTLFVAGKAIVFTSLALTFGFLSQVTSNFLPIILFSLLIALTMINTTIGSILLIPAAIRFTGIDLDRPGRFFRRKGKD
ncbi:MAG TPA: MMPL family transporter [Desulfosalsimonadaceae bacterium]|nr:MMPL family transporter [Desulfosalsimonadaceae bacterium]